MISAKNSTYLRITEGGWSHKKSQSCNWGFDNAGTTSFHTECHYKCKTNFMQF